MITRDQAEPLIKALQRKLSNGRLPEPTRKRLANIIGELTHLQSPINDIHAERLRDMLAQQLRYFGDARNRSRRTPPQWVSLILHPSGHVEYREQRISWSKQW